MLRVSCERYFDCYDSGIIEPADPKLARSPNMTERHREQAVEIIRSTSEMFKNVSNDRETTATLQADFLLSLFAHRDRLPAAAAVPDVWPRVDRASDQRASEQWGSNEINGIDFAAASNQAPVIDVTDFESWLSSFDIGNLADPHIGTPCFGPNEQAMVGNTDQTLPSTTNTDWDAVRHLAGLDVADFGRYFFPG